MIWHRANESIEVEGNTVHRPFLYPTPVLRADLSDYLSYDVRDDLAVSLIIMRTRGKHKSNYPELMAKQAMWAVKQLCEWTDIPESKTRLLLTITEDMREIAMPYLEACNFPMNKVYWINSREDCYPYITKTDAMRQPDFSDVKRFVHRDVVLMWGTRPTQRNLPLIANIMEHWTNQALAFTGQLFRSRKEQDKNPMKHFGERSVEMELWKEAARLTGKTPEEEYEFWVHADPHILVRGAMYGITADLLADSHFNDVLESIEQYAGDEAALAVYCRSVGWTQENVGLLKKPGITRSPYAVRGLAYPQLDTPIDMWLMQYKQ